jgi:riboflavin synthase
MMFTGIIKHQGRFLGYRQGRQEMGLESPDLAGRLAVGDSLAVNGVCLSVTAKERQTLWFNLARETLARTTLGRQRPGDLLNLEPSLTLATPLSGHLVTGHIDAKAKVLRVSESRPGKRMTISLPAGSRPFLVAQGSVAVDGVSLTVAAVAASSFEVELIPLTLKESTLGRLRPGHEVNLEYDIIGKYVYNCLNREKR